MVETCCSLTGEQPGKFSQWDWKLGYAFFFFLFFLFLFCFVLKTHLQDVLHNTHQWNKASREHTAAKIWLLVVSVMSFSPF